MRASSLLIPLILAGSAAAFADKPGKRWEGPISIEEAKAKTAEHFGRIDADGDGTLTPEELFSEESRRLREEQKRQRMFDRLDADGDGTVSMEEFHSRIDRLTRLDTNDDGQVTRDEFRAARHRNPSKRQRDG